MGRCRAKGCGERYNYHVMGETVTHVHGDDKGGPSLGIGRMTREPDQIDLAALRRRHYVSQRRLAERAAILDHCWSSLRSPLEREW